jgi:hypothetical protein
VAGVIEVDHVRYRWDETRPNTPGVRKQIRLPLGFDHGTAGRNAGGRAQRLHQPGRGPDRGDRARLICGELLDVGVAHIEAAGVVAVVDQVQDLFFLLDDGALDDRPSE